MTYVAGQGPKGRGEARTTRRGGAIAASLLAHVVVLSIIGLYVPKWVTPDLSAVKATDIWLMPPLIQMARARRSPKATTLRPAETTPLARPRAVAPTPQARAAQSPVMPSPPFAPPAARGPAPAAGPTDGGQGVNEALRTSVGCDAEAVVHLTPSEKEHCNQKFGELARKGPAFSGIDIAKRSRFDAQVEADDRRRALREGAMPEVVACDGPGSEDKEGCLSPSALKRVPF